MQTKTKVLYKFKSVLKVFILHIFLCISLLDGFSQDNKVNKQLFESPYYTSWKMDAPLLMGSLGLAASQYFLQSDKPLTIDFVNGLSKNDVNKFDRLATDNFSKAADRASDYFFYTSVGAPALLYADKAIRKDWKNVTVIMLETYLLGVGLTVFTKNVVDRPRPFLYNTAIPVEDKLGADGINSFVSGHTSMTALSTFMMAKIIVDYHPNTKYKPLIWSFAAAIPATTGLLRYGAGKHFFSDVLSGYAIGALTGYFIPHLHKCIKRKRAHKNSTTDFYGNTIHLF